MSFYEKYDCPVCKNRFTDGDDIVTCPECGTPHHRECYNAIGHCVNRGLHIAGYDFYNEQKQKELDPESEYFVEPVKDNANEYADTEANAPQNSTFPFGVAPFNIFTANDVYDNDEDTINGESVSDYAATVNTNASYFIPKFKDMEKKKKKLSWNWSAFFFGSFYLLMRKIYKQGIAFLCLSITVMYASSALLYKVAPNAVNLMNNLFASYSSGKQVTPEQIQSITTAADYNMAIKVSYITMLAFLVLRILTALFANHFYSTTISAIIKKVKSQLENGSSFVGSASISANGKPLDQSQLRKLYLSRKGGTSLWAPLFAMFVLTFLI